MKNLLIPGLWFKKEGPLGQKIQENGFDILDILGQDSIEERVYTLARYLEAHKNVTTILAHSGGALVLAHAAMEGHIPDRISQIVPMCSGALPGVKYELKDPTVAALAKFRYIRALATGAQYTLADDDILNLFSLREQDLESIKMNLAPDSGKFTREGLMGQFKPPFPKSFLHHKTKAHLIAEIRTTNDRIIGSTGDETSEYYHADKHIVLPGGHMQPLIYFTATLDKLRGVGIRF